MTSHSFGEHLRSWRRRRHLSQQALADRAELSTRHLSFLENGRSAPSREMVLRLAERLDVPLRQRNPILESAGYAPLYHGRSLDAPEMSAVRRALGIVLDGHMPNPCLAFDRCYDVVATNPAVSLLLSGVDAALLVPPVNVVRLSLHPGGLARHVVNFTQWRKHIIDRLERQLEQTGDVHVRRLMEEVRTYPRPALEHRHAEHEHPGVFLPLQLRTPSGVLSFLNTVTVFGTPHDVTLQELAIESFFPADDFTAEELVRLSGRAERLAPSSGASG